MMVGKYLLLFGLILGLLSCSNSQHVPVDELSQAPSVSMKSYVVRPGDTLYAIAWRFDWDYKALAAANNIPPPYLIKPGDEIFFEKQAVSTTSSPAKKTPQTAGNDAPNDDKKKKSQSSSQATADNQWLWPVDGKIIRYFSPQNKLSKGIDIEAAVGTPVRSSLAGEVVYAGNKLKGYGNLVIVRHNDVYLSAYAHNQVILVQEGQAVKKGQIIAKVGDTDADSPRLHFEIRMKGKPVNPLKLLPKK